MCVCVQRKAEEERLAAEAEAQRVEEERLQKELEERSAVMIQSGVRSHHARKRVAVLRAEKAERERIAAAEAEVQSQQTANIK